MKGIRNLLPLVFVMMMAPAVFAGSASPVEIPEETFQQEALETETLTAIPQGPQYVTEQQQIPWGGFIAIPAFALVFLFPVIAVKYFPSKVNPATAQP